MSESSKCRKCNGTGRFQTYGRCFACDGTGYVKAVTPESCQAAIPVDASKIRLAFDTAKRNSIPIPRVQIGSLLFKAAGPDSRHPKGILVVNPDAQYPDNFYGWIRDGNFYPSHRWPDSLLPELQASLLDPAAAAEAFGRKVGICGVCGRTLLNHESIRIGIGPICRARMGWESDQEQLAQEPQTFDSPESLATVKPVILKEDSFLGDLFADLKE